MSNLLDDETKLFVADSGHCYRIQFFNDHDPIEPWDDDGALPLVWLNCDSSRYQTRAARGFDLLNPLEFLTDRKITANLHRLALLSGYLGRDALNRDARDYYPGIPLADARRNLLQEEWLSDGSHTRARLDQIAELWRIAGVPADVITSRGYSQGDVSYLLIVAHPEAVKDFGFATMAAYKKRCPNDIQDAANTWGAWAWGGCIGYRAELIDSEEWEAEGGADDPDSVDLNGLRHCEEIDSCWGYYPEGTAHYFPLDKAHSYAVGEALDACKRDAEPRAKAEAAARAAQIESDAIEFAAAMEAARPDLAPQWVSHA